MIWLSLVLVFLGYAIGLWVAVMEGYRRIGLIRPAVLRDPATAIVVTMLNFGLLGVGLILGFLQGIWYGIGSLAFLAVLWLVGTELGHYWIRAREIKLLQAENSPPTSSPELKATTAHSFLEDLKEAYKDSNLIYDANVEHVLFSKLPKPQTPSEHVRSDLPAPKNTLEKRVIDQTVASLASQFFKRVKTGGRYCPPEEIKKLFGQMGQSPEDLIGVSSGGYYRLFVAYWTLKAKLRRHEEANIRQYDYASVQLLDALFAFLESSMAGAFFPTAGPHKIPEAEHRQGIEEMLKMYAPTMTIRDLYEGADLRKVPWPILK